MVFLGVDPWALQTIIKYIYTHDKTLFTEDNMAEVMQLADFLQCKPIIELCREMIIKNPGLETLPLYVKYSEPTKKEIPQYVRQTYLPDHFLELIHHPNFVTNITDVEDLKVILDAILPLTCNSECHILAFRVLIFWVAISKNREVHACELLTKIQYDLITQVDIINVVLPGLTELSDCGDLIDKLTRYIENPFEQPFMSVGKQRFRKDPVIHAFGVQDDIINLKSDAMAFNLNYLNYIVNYWPLSTTLARVLEPKGDCIEHYAFIVGGYTQEEGSEAKIPNASFIRYNMLTQEILTLKDLPQPTFSSAVIFHEKACQLWVIGGVVKKAETYQLTEEVHIYDVKTNEWKKGPSLPEPLSQLAVCEGSDAFDGIFISGGVTMKMEGCSHSSHRVVRKTVYMITKDTSRWTEFGTLSRGRYGHAMYVRDSDFEGKREPELYIVGGKSPDVLQEQNINTPSITDNIVVDAFSLHSDTKSIYKAQQVVGNCFGQFSLNGESYLFSECVGSESETVVNNWCDYGSNNSPFTGFTGLCQRKLPFSLKGALILSCWQKFDLKSNSKGPDVETSFLPSLSNGEESEEEEEEEDGSEDSDY